MELPEHFLMQTAILVLAICGFFVARHIYKHKDSRNKPLVCPIRFDCHTVVHSDYSKFCVVPVEIWGMIYYAVISLAYIFFIIINEVVPVLFVGFIILLSITAFLFSVYLICVQIFILKKGCSWCIVSAFICLVIFILTMVNYDFSYVLQIFAR